MRNYLPLGPLLGLILLLSNGSEGWAATFTVNSTLDSADAAIGDGVCDDGSGNCTLRAAIQEANFAPAADIIEFNIGGGGAQTIVLGSGLPPISASVSINGNTQPGFINSPLVEIDATSSVGTYVLQCISFNAFNLRNIAISNTPSGGIRTLGISSALIDGVTLSDNGNIGIGVQLEFGSGIIIQNCTINARVVGINSTGSTDVQLLNNDFQNNTTGIRLQNIGSGSLVGGVNISGNNFAGNNTALDLRTMSDLTISDGSVVGTNVALGAGHGLETVNSALRLSTVSNSRIENLDLSRSVGVPTGTAISPSGCSNLTIENVTVSYRSIGIRIVSGNTVSISCSTFFLNVTGVHPSNNVIGLTVQNCLFAGHSSAAVLNPIGSDPSVDATSCYWGASDGPSNLGGSGDSYVGPGAIDATGFLASAPSCAGAPGAIPDFGDAPNTYGTLLASDGARHFPIGPRLGSVRDTEVEGLPTAGADGDDLDGGADDEEATATTPVTGFDLNNATGNQVSFNLVSSPADYEIWVDWDQNGVFDNPADLAASGSIATDGLKNVPISVPGGTLEGNTFMRVRVYSTGDALNSPVGGASSGEVEDYAVALFETTLVDLLSFDTSTNSDGSVTIRWETGSELENAGFNLLRLSAAGDDVYEAVVVNPQLIPAKGSSVLGAQYEYVDRPGYGQFLYQLEDFDLSGTRSRHQAMLINVAPRLSIHRDPQGGIELSYLPVAGWIHEIQAAELPLTREANWKSISRESAESGDVKFEATSYQNHLFRLVVNEDE